jgi:hypothetical protein
MLVLQSERTLHKGLVDEANNRERERCREGGRVYSSPYGVDQGPTGLGVTLHLFVRTYKNKPG